MKTRAEADAAVPSEGRKDAVRVRKGRGGGARGSVDGSGLNSGSVERGSVNCSGVDGASVDSGSSDSSSVPIR